MKRAFFSILLAGVGFSNLLAEPEEGGRVWVAEVRGMSCPLCAKNIEKQLAKVSGVVDSEVDLGSGTVKIHFASGFRGSAADISKAIKDAGFTVVIVKELAK